jgi:penicillin-binding protein 1A
LGVKEMGGKTGTTNDNADAWFMGYTPQLLAGVWIGCDDRFIRIESAQGYGGTAARPIFQAFFKKAMNDKNLGLDKQATFPIPADLQNEITNADIMEIIPNENNASGEDQNMNADDYTLDTTSYQNMKPESEKPVEDLQKKEPKKDTISNKPIGSATKPEEKKEKKGFFKKLFGGKDKDKDKPKEKSNDY